MPFRDIGILSENIPQPEQISNGERAEEQAVDRPSLGTDDLAARERCADARTDHPDNELDDQSRHDAPPLARDTPVQC